MANGLPPQVVDIPMLLPNQTPPKHAGPLGRINSMLNAQIKHFLPSSQAAPQKINIDPRDGFTALTTECRDSGTGAIVTGDWSNPELLAPLGDQLLSICDSIPRVNNGASWTNYGNNRVVTNRLSEDVLHTTNHTLQAPDSAYLSGVTCFVWTETTFNGPVTLNNSMVGFRGDDAAWIRTPTQLFQNAAGNAMARVVQDGTYFWVYFNTGAKIVINVFDTHGVLIASDSTTIPLSWTPTPGYWDIAAFNGGTPYIVLAQPDGFSSVGANVGVRLYQSTVAGSVITTTNSKDVTISCVGPVAFSDQSSTLNAPVIIVTSGTSLFMVQFGPGGVTATHVWSFGAVLAGSTIPDGMTGWIEPNGGGPIAHVAYSLLSNFSPSAGPANDPGLRYVRSYACTFAGVVTLTTQANNVLLQSRAFKVDQDWYAATYYQGGAGNVSAPAVQTIATDDTDDYFTGATSQPVTVAANDFATGGAGVSLGAGYVVPTQFSGAITHNVADNVAATTRTWHFVNAIFSGIGTAPFDGTSQGASAAGALLHITGAANAGNNGDWWITSVTSATDVVTEATSLQGNPMVTETFGVGVTVTLTQVWPFFIPQATTGTFAGNTHYPDVVMYNKFTGGTVVASGFSGAAVAVLGTYSIFRMYTASTWRGYTLAPNSDIVLCTKSSGVAGNNGDTYAYGGTLYPPAGLAISPLVPNDWALLGFSGPSGNRDQRSGVGMNLVVAGAQKGGNNGTFLETGISANYNRNGLLTGSQPAQQAELFLGFGPSLPTVTRVLADPSQAFMWHLKNLTLDPSYIGATLVMTGSLHPEDNGVFQIVALVPAVDTHTFIAVPTDGKTGQTLYNMVSTEVVTITRATTSGTPAYQPCWFLTPLSFPQHVAGRWEWAIAYADWRLDGNTKANLGTFERNGYPLALSSVVTGLAGKQVTLPFRAQSFTAGQTVTDTHGGIIGIQSTAESTVGLKLFTLAALPGQAAVNSGEMLLPGAMAAEFTASGFTEDAINLGPEKPFLVGSPTTDGAIALGLTLGATYQLVAVFEVMSESGDRIWSVTSPPLDFTMQGTQNTATYGGRMPGPTNRIVGISLYRTANVGSPPTATIQHYKITNDLQVNGPGFTFSSVNGGAANDTWQFKDQIPDQTILQAETLLTDKGFLQRFPAPAFRQGVGSWENRTWVIGYDGAVWMSGEKSEGDSVWFHPAFRYVLPTDDKPVALAAMENYLLVFCSRSIWFIPAAQFPDNTGANGSLPTPQPLPFRNGCTGFVQTVKAGVAYSSTAGGVWLIDRALQNIYLSQPLQDDLTTGITGMTVDGRQRLVVTVGTTDVYVFDELSQGWLHWTVGAAAQLVTTWQGNATYQDAARVRQQAPGTFADITDGVAAGVALSVAMTLVMGAVKALKRVWALNLTGSFLGQCRLTAFLSYPDDSSSVSTYGPFAASASVMNIEINPLIEEASTFNLTIFVDFVGVSVPGASISLELITAEVGIESTLAKRPNAQRLPGG